MTDFRRKLILKPKPNPNKPRKRINPKFPVLQEQNLPLHPPPLTLNPLAPPRPHPHRRNRKKRKIKQEQQLPNPTVTAKRTAAERSRQVKVPHPVAPVQNLHLASPPLNLLPRPSPVQGLHLQPPPSALTPPPHPQ